MSSSVDNEVVSMKFDNSAFERGVSTTLSTLAKLKTALGFPGAAKGLTDVESAANKFNMDTVSSGIDGLSKKFSALRIIGISALSNIANKAVDAGLRMVKAFTIEPIKEGFEGYQNQIDATKIILSNTAQSGAKLKDVTNVLDKMQKYAQLTVYNFADMAKNVGTFTANGVGLKQAAGSIKGIANLAALSGASSQDASRAMYQLSQAIGSGSVKLQDWNSVQNANLGTNTFKNALTDTALAMGTLTKDAVKFSGPMKNVAINGESFRASLTSKPGQTGWLTSKVLTNTLSQFTGQISKAQLLTEGFTAAQAKAIIATGKMALNSATQVKTWNQLTQALKEEVAGAYSKIFKALFGDLPQATKLFSAMHTTLENLLTGPLNNFATVLSKAIKIVGRTKAIEAVKNIFTALGKVLGVVKDAYREVFPAQTAKDLAGFITKFGDFTKKLIIGKSTADNLKKTFAGVFAVLDIGKQLILGVFHVFGQLFGSLGSGASGFLGVTANIGDMLVAFDNAIKKGGLIKNIFRIIGNVLQIPIRAFGLLATAVSSFFSGFNFHSASKGVTGFANSTGGTLNHLANITSNISGFFDKMQDKITAGVPKIVTAFQGIGSAIAKGLNSQATSQILKVLQTGLLASIALTMKHFFKGGFGLSIEPGKGIFGGIKESLEGVTGSLKAMQTQLKAKALLEIAAALAVLALSLVALSNIDPKKLQGGLKAMGVAFGELLGAMAILTKVTGSAGFVKIPIMAASLDLLAGAILILTAAVAILSRMSWEQLEKGLSAIGILLAGLSAAAIPLSANSGGMIRAGVGISAMAVALNLLAVAVKLFSLMSWSAMLKGLAGIGIALAGIAVAMKLMPKGMVLQAAALNLIATAVNGLYFAVNNFSKLSWGEMVKGLVGVAGGLVAIALAMKLMPPTFIADAAGLALIAIALGKIATAVAAFAAMSWTQIAKGLVGLAGSLAVLAIAVEAMSGTLLGAASLLVIAHALGILLPEIEGLTKISFKTLLKDIGKLAIVFAALAAAALLMMPVIPELLALGAALTLLGVAALAFGAGAALLGVGLTAIAASGGAAIAVLLTGLHGLINLLPAVVASVGVALVGLIKIIGTNAPAIIGAFVKLLTAFLNAVPKIIPPLVKAMGAVVQGILKVLVDNAPKIISAGFKLLMDLLKGIRDNIAEIVTTVSQIIVKFLNALAKNLDKIIDAGVNLLFKLLEGIAKAAGKLPGEVIKLIGIFLKALFGDFPKIVSAGISMVGKLADGVIGAAGKLASAGVTLVKKLISGIVDWASHLLDSGFNLVKKIARGMKNGFFNLINDIPDMVTGIGKAIVDGITNGITGLPGAIYGKLKGAISSGLSKLGGFLGIGGPAMLLSDTIGVHIPEGVAHGIDKNTGMITTSMRTMAKSSILEMKKTMAGLGDAINSDDINFNPTVTPVLDLSQIKKDASQINGLVSANPVNAKLSADQASAISANQAEQAAAATAETPKVETPTSVQFVQNNNSPKALSTVQIYRQTNNQLARAKQVLGLSS